MFRRIFYTIWYILHLKHLARFLFLFVFGLVFLFGSFYYGTTKPLSKEAEDITLANAVTLINKSEPKFVRLNAELDFENKIFRTGGWAPYWGHCPPDTIHESPDADGPETEFRKLLGCRVRTTGHLSDDVTRLVQKTPDNGSGSDPMQVNFVPLSETGHRIWVRSDFFKKGDAYEEEWLKTENFSGILSTMDKALRTLPKGYINLRYAPRTVRPGTYVIVPCDEYKDRAREYFSANFWVPVKGSASSLFVWASNEFEASFDGVITGVLKPLGQKDHDTLENEYLQFEVVMGNEMPERFAVIKRKTGEDYNRHMSGVAGMFLIFGIMWAGGGLFGMVVYIGGPLIIYKAWQKAAEELELLATGKKTGVASDAPREKRQRPVRGASLIKNVETRSPATHTNSHISLLKDLNKATKDSPVYLAMAQDFMSLSNYGGFFTATGIYGAPEKALNALYSQGQREPGLVVEVLASNSRMFSSVYEQDRRFPEAYEAFRFDWIVLRHAQTKFVTKRFGICEVFGSNEQDGLIRAERTMKQQDVFSVAARICEIADSEHGPYTGIKKIKDRSSIKGIR